MTDIEKKALALVNEVYKERGYAVYQRQCRHDSEWFEALCRAIEQHEAFRQEVSDAVEAALSVFDQLVLDDRGEAALRGARLVFARFIIAKPDPLVEVIATALREGSPFCEDGSHSYMDEAKVVAAAIKKRGGKIVWEANYE